jgi:hypothetical protein
VDVTGNITAKIFEVWSEFNIFYTLVTMTTAIMGWGDVRYCFAMAILVIRCYCDIHFFEIMAIFLAIININLLLW